MRRPHSVPLALSIALAAAGCATSSLDLAPASPATPFVPADAVAPVPMTEADFGLPARPVLAVVQPPPDIDPTRIYALPDLIDLAQTTNPATRVAWEQARQAALAVGIVKASYLPVVTATVLGGIQRMSASQSVPLTNQTGTLGTEATGTISTAALQWLLFDFGQRDALVKAAGKLSLASNIAFNAVHQKIIYDVGRQFYEFGAARERTRISVASQRDAQVILDAADSRFRQGVGTSVEVAQAKQMLAQANFAVVQSRNTERDAYNSLIGAMGVSPITQIRVADASSHPLPPQVGAPLVALVEAALSRRPDLQVAVATAQASRAGIAAAEADFLPKVFASVSGNRVSGSLTVTSLPIVGQVGSSALGTSPSNSNVTVLGGVSVPLFDGGVRAARLQEARSRTAQAEDTFVRLQQDAAREVVVAADALKSTLASFQAASSLVAASTVSYDATLSAYRSGAGTITAALEAQRALLAARNARGQAHGTAQIAAATLAFAMGNVTNSQAFSR